MTRGCLAVKKEEGGWVGIHYRHSAFPMGLGPAIFEGIRREGLDNVVRYILEAPEPITDEDADPRSIEWLYLIDPATYKMDIFVGAIVGGSWEEGFAYDFVYVDTIDLRGEEPNWEEIEKKGNEKRL